MDVLNKLAANAMSGLEKESLVTFMRSFCVDLTQAGEIPGRDKPVAEAFQKVYETALLVEEKTKELESNESPSADDIKDAKGRLGELRCAVDKLQTSALSNPPLRPFTKKVAERASEMARSLEKFTEEGSEGELGKLYDRFEHLKEEG